MIGSPLSWDFYNPRHHWLTLDCWLAKDNRFLIPKSSYERILTVLVLSARRTQTAFSVTSTIIPDSLPLRNTLHFLSFLFSSAFIRLKFNGIWLLFWTTFPMIHEMILALMMYEMNSKGMEQQWNNLNIQHTRFLPLRAVTRMKRKRKMVMKFLNS